MAITLSTGTVIAIAKTYATADPVSNMSNATGVRLHGARRSRDR